MASLTKCTTCGHQVSSDAAACPSCGQPLKRKTSGCAVLLAVLAVFALMGLIFSDPAGRGAPAEPQSAIDQTQATDRKTVSAQSRLPDEAYSITGTQGVAHLIEVKGEYLTNPENLARIVREICGSDDICKVMMWHDGAPSTLPMSAEQTKTMWVDYSYNRHTGRNRWLVNCRYFGETEDPSLCMAGTLP